MAFYSMLIMVLIIVVVSFLLYFSLRKYFKKSILIVACCCIALIGLLSVVFYNAGFQDSVFVYGITAQENDENPSFSYDIKNRRIFMSGTHTEVKIDISKTDLFDDIKKTKTVFDEQNNAIHVTENGEVFSITYKGENVYEFSCNYIRMNKGKDRLVPFPDYMMEKFSQDYEYDKPYDVNCDFSYLKEFYELYKGAVVEENSIEFSGKTIQMQGGKVTITQSK